MWIETNLKYGQPHLSHLTRVANDADWHRKCAAMMINEKSGLTRRSNSGGAWVFAKNLEGKVWRGDPQLTHCNAQFRIPAAGIDLSAVTEADVSAWLDHQEQHYWDVAVSGSRICGGVETNRGGLVSAAPLTWEMNAKRFIYLKNGWSEFVDGIEYAVGDNSAAAFNAAVEKLMAGICEKFPQYGGIDVQGLFKNNE